MTQELQSSVGTLTEDEVLRRLFAPATYLPKSRSDKAIVSVTSYAERHVSHEQVETLVLRAGAWLKEHGAAAGDNIVFFSENSPEFSSAILGCWTLNAMAVLVDFRAPREDVLDICKNLGAKLLVTSKHLYKNFSSETGVFTRAGVEVLEISALAESKNGAAHEPFDVGTLDLDGHAFTILTSGTTGKPKVSVHTLRSLVLNLTDLANASGLEPGLTALTPLPISHIFGLTVLLVTQILGMKTVLTSLEPKPFVMSIHKFKPELIAALPQFYGGMMSAPDGYINLSNARLLLCGGAPLTVSLAEKFFETFGKNLNNGYGSTESKIVALNQDGPTLCVGKPIGAVKIEIVNELNDVLPDGALGEVRISSEMLMDGYLNNPDATRKVLRDGYYYTEDLGRIEDGNLFVVGRKTDVVITADGAIVHSGEVEEVLRSNPAVKEVAVTGVSDGNDGQLVQATVVVLDKEVGDKLKSDNEAEAEEARKKLQEQFEAFASENLSRSQRPSKWEFLGPHDRLPKTLAGKIDKKKLSKP